MYNDYVFGSGLSLPNNKSERKYITMNKVKTAVVGLGGRGYGILTGLLLGMENAEVVAVCDLYEDRVKAGADAVEQRTGVRPFVSTDYREVLDRDDVEAVLILSAWESHFPIAIYAMEKGVADRKSVV